MLFHPFPRFYSQKLILISYFFSTPRQACSDILVISSDGSSVLLGKRKVEPQPDWWFIGGRARPGKNNLFNLKRLCAKLNPQTVSLLLQQRRRIDHC